ncbi:bifunctional methylenetetrahydrofolate dehydrogenase/methenyltetrahydrofolate cyclohydrolase, partial [Pseudomonas monteilii]|nr:bifunctional methylenetetrahydrofolate dehydrogenase/methenyltetrahydrofolate cyclohydrolase [Pseudomonas monteilii]
MGTLINGKELAEKMQAAFLSETATLKEQGVTPGLVVLLVGEDKASQTYVKNKELAAAKIGINSRVARYPESITEAELLAEIEQFNNDDAFHGILVQLPLPKHINEEKVLLAIKPEKDVDGFHPINLGKLFAGVPDRIPCTPYGIMKMFAAYGIELEGKNALVIGRSNIVGKPMAH